MQLTGKEHLTNVNKALASISSTWEEKVEKSVNVFLTYDLNEQKLLSKDRLCSQVGNQKQEDRERAQGCWECNQNLIKRERRGKKGRLSKKNQDLWVWFRNPLKGR